MGRQFIRLLAAEVCASAVIMLDTPCSEIVWRVLATHSILQFPHSLPLPCVTVFHHISAGVYRGLQWPSNGAEFTETRHQSLYVHAPFVLLCHELYNLSSQYWVCRLHRLQCGLVVEFGPSIRLNIVCPNWELNFVSRSDRSGTHR
jgi:hypothetical protein